MLVELNIHYIKIGKLFLLLLYLSIIVLNIFIFSITLEAIVSVEKAISFVYEAIFALS